MDIDKAVVLTENISVRLALGQALETGVASPTQKDIPDTANKIGIIKVFDSLVSKGGAGESGFTSYEEIKNQIQNLITYGKNYTPYNKEQYIGKGVTKIVFYIDSPGGEALGMEGIVNYIASLPSLGIQTFSFTDGMATSAAYGIALATQKIYSMSTAKTGSIGTILTLMDVTKRDEQQGIKYLIMRSKEEKAMYNPHEVVSKEIAKKAEEEMMLLDNAFNSLANKYRPNLSIEKIISLKGNAFYGEEALSLGLVDKLVSGFDEVLSLEGISTTKQRKGNFIMNEEEILRQNAELKAQLAALQVSADTSAKTLMAAERERVSKLTLAANELKIPQDRLTKAIDSGISYEDGLAAFTTFAEISGSNSSIDTSGAHANQQQHSQQQTDKDNPFAFLSAMDEAIKLGLLG